LLPDPGAQRIEDIALGFLERDDEVLRQDDAHLLDLDVLCPFVDFHHLDNGEQEFRVSFHFGALGRIENVLQDKRMNVVFPADRFQDIHPVKTVDVDPGHGALFGKGKGLFDVLQIFFYGPILCVMKKPETRFSDHFFSDMDQGSGRKAGLL
jgi:hypothetical protein